MLQVQGGYRLKGQSYAVFQQDVTMTPEQTCLLYITGK